MAVITRDVLFNDAHESPSSGWLTVLGVVSLIGTVAYDLSGLSIPQSIEIIGRSADFLSIFIF